MSAVNTVAYGSGVHAYATRTRVLGVAGAVLAAVAVWLVAVPVLGNQLLIRFGQGAAQGVGLPLIVGATLLGSLGGWGLLAVLERRNRSARRAWTACAVVVAVASLSLPLTAGTTVATKLTLALMHLVVAAVLISALRRA